MDQAPPALAATSEGVLNMPAPTTMPTISAIASRNSSTGTGRASHGGVASRCSLIRELCGDRALRPSALIDFESETMTQDSQQELTDTLARMGLLHPGEAFRAETLAGGVSSDISRITLPE